MALASLTRNFLLALTLAAATTACGGVVPTNVITDAQQLGSAAQRARSTLGLVPADYDQSCERAYRWTYLDISEIDHLAALKHQPTTVPPKNICNAADVQAAKLAWSSWNNVLLDYFQALGNLAAALPSDAFGFDAAAKSAVTILTANQGATPSPKNPPDLASLQAQATAISGAADTIATILYSQKQAKDLAAQLNDTQVVDVVNKTVAALKSVEFYYNAELNDEEIALNQFYSNNLAAIPAGASILGDYQAFAKDWGTELSALQSRRAAAQAYLNALDTLETSFTKTVAAAKSASGEKKDTSVILGLIQQLEPSLDAIRAAYTNTTPVTAKGG